MTDGVHPQGGTKAVRRTNLHIAGVSIFSIPTAVTSLDRTPLRYRLPPFSSLRAAPSPPGQARGAFAPMTASPGTLPVTVIPPTRGKPGLPTAFPAVCVCRPSPFRSGRPAIQQSIISLLPREDNKDKDKIDRTLRKINIADIVKHEDNIIAKEFFALTTSRKWDTKDNTSTARYRSTDLSDPYYRLKFDGFKYGVFDVMCVFVNLLNIKKCYERFDAGLYKKAMSTEDSILKRLIKGTRDRDGDNLSGANLGKRMLSWFAIRNVEILDDMVDELNNKDYRSVKDGNKGIIEQYFRNIGGDKMKEKPKRDGGYKIETYDKGNGDGGHIEVDFGFAGILADIVHAIPNVLFESIYTPNSEEKPEKFSAEYIMARTKKGASNKGRRVLDKIKEHFPKEYNKHLSMIFTLFEESTSYTYEEMWSRLSELEAYINTNT